MKKQNSLILTAICLANLGFSQIQNPGFESWSSGSPTGWITSNVPGFIEAVSQSSDAHAGNSSLELTVDDFNGTNVGGAAYQTEIPFSGDPSELRFYYKGVINETVSLLGVVTFSNADDELIALGSVAVLESSSAYSLAVITPEYLAEGTITKANITISMVVGEGTPAGNEYARIDDVSFGSTIHVDEVSGNAVTINAFPNPSSSGNIQLAIETNVADLSTISILDTNGKVVQSEKRQLQVGENRLQYDLSQYAKGMYFVRVITRNEAYTSPLIID